MRLRRSRTRAPQDITIVEQLPKTVTGKIRKHILRDEGITNYGLSLPASVQTA